MRFYGLTFRAENSPITFFHTEPNAIAYKWHLLLLYLVYMNLATSLRLNNEGSVTIYGCTPATCYSLYIYK